jgi:NAD-dependent deacetylase
MKDAKVQLAAKWIIESDKIVVFTGAGISTESGLPDFRGPNGVWTRRDKGLPPPRTRVPWSEVEPNQAHLAIVELQNIGKLDFLISQNVDNLHLKSGILPKKIAELHGNTTLMRCLSCDRQFKKQAVGWDEARWGKGYRTMPPKKGQPNCPKCGGRLISSVVNFGDPLSAKDLKLAKQHSMTCDLFIAIGSSLVVIPAAEMPRYALEAGAKFILINKGETPYDDLAHLRFDGKAGVIMSEIIKKVKQMLDIYRKSD